MSRNSSSRPVIADSRKGSARVWAVSIGGRAPGDGHTKDAMRKKNLVTLLGIALVVALISTGVFYGLFVNNQAHQDILITGNTLTGSVAPLALASGGSAVANGVQWFSNEGVDNVVPSVASAATLAFPVNPSFVLTGTTGVTAVSGLFTGERGMFIPTNATPPAFTAGATIGNSCSTVQNKPYSYTFDGTKIWISGNGC